MWPTEGVIALSEAVPRLQITRCAAVTGETVALEAAAARERLATAVIATGVRKAIVDNNFAVVSAPSLAALAYIPAVGVVADAGVLADSIIVMRAALVHVTLAMGASVASARAFARIVRWAVDADAPVSARSTRALVDVCLAADAREPCGARAFYRR